MKQQKSKLQGLLKIVTVLSILGAWSIAQAQIVVDMRVSSNEDELEITTHGSCEGPKNRKGCIGVSGQVLINFLLKRKKCSSDGIWELHQVVLGEEKGSPGNIGIDAASDFDADEVSGVVNLKKQTARHIQIRDDNLDEYDIWYTVSAKCAAGDKTIYTDPRIRNDGTG